MKHSAPTAEIAAKLDKSRPLGKDELEAIAQQLIAEAGLPEGYLGWTMVALATAFWEPQVAATPFDARLFLLPHCLKARRGLPGRLRRVRPRLPQVRRLSRRRLQAKAEDLGYKVLVSEGTPIVLKIIVSGHVDAIVGVACLNVLEKAIDKILLAGIPAWPYRCCRATAAARRSMTIGSCELIDLPCHAARCRPKTYVHLMRAAASMFEPQELERLLRGCAGRLRVLAATARPRDCRLDPVAGTEAIAYDLMGKGGKRSRPFITLAAYDALTAGGHARRSGIARLRSRPIKRAAMAIETSTKPRWFTTTSKTTTLTAMARTLHRKYGVATAINVGDYLIGLGYRLVSRDAQGSAATWRPTLSTGWPKPTCELTEGQGAELLWRDVPTSGSSRSTH